MDAGLLPVKGLARAKKRLAPSLSSEERLVVARALFEDALDLCAASQMLRWWVVSDDAEVLEAAEGRGFGTLHDEGSGLNAALEVGIAALIEHGVTSVTIVPADVPLAYSGDIQDLLDTGATSEVVVVPSRNGGTNALYLSPPDVLAPSFGDASLREHLLAAEAAGARCSILPLPRLELDIDTIEDVDAFLARPRPVETRSSELLARLRGRRS